MLVVVLVIFLVTFVVPNFAELYWQHVGAAAADDADPDRGGNHGPQLHTRWFGGFVIAAVVGFPVSGPDGEAARLRIDSVKLRIADLWRHLDQVSRSRSFRAS